MSLLSEFSVEEIQSRGSIRDADVQALRKAFYDDGTITAAEADTLFEINSSSKVQDRTWTDFFVEAMTDYTVNQALPEGYVTVENAEWLISKISHDGRVDTTTELELLINVIDKARWAPTRLVQYALAQVKQAVITGEGPIRSGKALMPGVVTEGEVDLLRRILYAFGGDGHIAVSRAEAEVLFDINDATSSADNHPAWTELFVKAVANAIMANSGYAVPTREEALRRERWLVQRGDLSLGSMLTNMFSGGLGGILAAYRQQSPEERAIARLEQQRVEIITNERITTGEAEWLAERIARDGKVHDNEKALLTFLKRESPEIHPALKDLIERYAEAA